MDADRFVEDHVLGERRGARPMRIFRTLQHMGKYLGIVLRYRWPAAEERRHEGAKALRCLRHLGLDQRFDRLWRDSASIVFEADRILQRQHLGRVGIIAGEIDNEHAAKGVADDRRTVHAEAVEQRLGVARQKIEMIADASKTCRSRSGPALSPDSPG